MQKTRREKRRKRENYNNRKEKETLLYKLDNVRTE